MIEILFFLLGLIVGSFLNVVIVRVPLNQSIVNPPSHCPKCDHKITPLENIPVISYIVLWGKCSQCGEKISPRYVIVEILTGTLFLLLFLKFGLGAGFPGIVTELIPFLFMVSVLISVSFIDLEHHIIPNKIIFPSYFAALLLIALTGLEGLKSGLIGFFVGGTVLFVIAIIQPGGMGMGDVKLAGFIGLFLGVNVLLALFLSFLIGSIVSLCLIALKMKTRKDKIAFGPFLSMAAIISIFYGDVVLNAYLGLFKVSVQ